MYLFTPRRMAPANSKCRNNGRRARSPVRARTVRLD